MKTNMNVDSKIGRVELGLIGDRAMFARPETKCHGHPMSYTIPTEEAIRGILKKIYWHPKPFEIDYRVVAVRVMNDMYKFETVANSYRDIDSSMTQVVSTYLKNVHYQIVADIVYKDGKDHGTDTLIKSENIFNRRVKRRIAYDDNMFFGTSECRCYIVNEKFGDGKSFYDGFGPSSEVENTNMFIRFTHLDDLRNGKKIAHFGNVKMNDGVVTYPRNNDCREVKIY